MRKTDSREREGKSLHSLALGAVRFGIARG